MSWDALSTASESSNKLLLGSIYLAIYLLANFWQGQVTNIVPEPYLVCSSHLLLELLLILVRMKSSIFHKRKLIAQEISTSGIPNSPRLQDCKVVNPH